MQGRLSQKENLPLQSFPVEWEQEFSRARDIGFMKIEWLVDKEMFYDNPLFSDVGRSKIIKIKERNKIDIDTLCAHFLINGKILSNNLESDSIRKFFLETVKLAPLIGIKYVSIPFIGDMSLNKKEVFIEMRNLLKEIEGELKIEILIESDLESYKILDFIESVGSSKLGILYDTGNATKQKLLFNKEFSLLEEFIKEIHIKDFDIKAKKSVRLGCGDTDFKEIFATFKKYHWKGPIVFETPILKDWSKEASLNLDFILNILKKEI